VELDGQETQSFIPRPAPPAPRLSATSTPSSRRATPFPAAQPCRSLGRSLSSGPISHHARPASTLVPQALPSTNLL